jgi:hypothetical protein
MKLATALLLASVALTCASGANAASPNLKGQYAVTGTAECINSNVGFTPSPDNRAICNNGFPVGVGPNAGQGTCLGVFATSFGIEGVRTFNGDGTGTAKVSSVSITPTPNVTFVGAGSEDATFSFTYTLDEDGGFTTQLVPGSFAGTNTSGPRTGQTVTQDKLSLTGLMSNNRQALTLATVTPDVEKQTFSNGDTRYRICHRSRTLILMGN